MTAIVDLQFAEDELSCSLVKCPELKICEQLVQQVLTTLDISETKECTIRIVNEQESAELNEQYRGKSGPTNVLSFPFESPIEIDIDLLGDLVICAPLVLAEAKEQNKTEIMHWSHLIVHGTLHLLGYDHVDESDAEKMESLECEIMNKLGYSDPYQMIE